MHIIQCGNTVTVLDSRGDGGLWFSAQKYQPHISFTRAWLGIAKLKNA